MKVCYFGIYDREYSRNKILISGLTKNGVEVIECVSQEKGIWKYLDLFRKHWDMRNSYDVMVVGYPGFQAMILARFITSKPIVFDAFLSLYDSMVLDRAQVHPSSLRALYFWYLDKISMTLAEVVLLDTNEHIKFVSREFNIGDDKFRRIFVGADTAVFYPRTMSANNVFLVSFYGHFIPLQGVEYIVRAAKLLEGNSDIVYEIIGDGQEKKKILDLAEELQVKNIRFIGNVPLAMLATKMAESDVCLGIFGNTDKAKRVIPNKVFECIAMSRPVVTADTKAIREMFTDDEIFFAETANPQSISDAILKVKSNKENAEAVAKRGYDKLVSTASIDMLGSELKNILEAL